MKKIFSLVIILLLVLSIMIMFVSSNRFNNYLVKSNNKVCNFIFYLIDSPRYSNERKAKYGVFGEAVGAISDANFPHDFTVITNNTDWQEFYKIMRNKYFNADFINDFYYIRNTNWCEIGYFIIKPGKKIAIINYYTWFSNSTSDWTTGWTSDWYSISLNEDEFYKTNTIFRKGLFKTRKLISK